jgi:hypothetical protein
MPKRRELLLGLLTVCITVTLWLVCAEIVFRFLPVASGMRTLPVTYDRPVFQFTPNRAFLFSRDWDLTLVNRGRVNNAGFVNDQDYRKDDALPLLAVVGDSMIEAAMVPYGETVHGRLAKALDGRLRVYSFAAAGAPLSQYLIWVRHAVSEYGAQAVVINVTPNDFDESHVAHKGKPGFWQYYPAADGNLELRLYEYRPGLFRDLVVSSALLRYIVFNAHLSEHWVALQELIFGRPANAQPRRYGVTPGEIAKLRYAQAATEAFFRDLPQYARLPRSRILFTMDGWRYPDAAAHASGSFRHQLHTFFREKAEAQGYEVIDLDNLFFERHLRNGERFEFTRDAHWNSNGHKVAFEGVMASRLLDSFGSQCKAFSPVPNLAPCTASTGAISNGDERQKIPVDPNADR